jgi:hypothetical protein
VRMPESKVSTANTTMTITRIPKPLIGIEASPIWLMIRAKAA